MNYTFIDGDSLLFRCAYGDKTTEAIMRTRWDDKVEWIKGNTWADEVLIAVKGLGNFREQLDPEYKAQRPTLDDSLKKRLNFVHSYAVDNGAVKCDGWEADDQVVAWAWETVQEGNEFVIAGIDKDLLQFPGNHYDYGGTTKKPMAENDRWHFTSVEEGYERFCAQLLTGDTVDNIKGISKVGPVKAKKALADKSHNEMMQTVCDMYKDEYSIDWKRKLHVNCNLIYMRRWLEDEFLYEEHLDDRWKK